MTQNEGAGRHPARRSRRQAPAVPGLPLEDYEDEDDLGAYVKEVVDALPPLTDEQRDLLALIFRQRRKLTATTRHPRPARCRRGRPRAVSHVPAAWACERAR